MRGIPILLFFILVNYVYPSPYEKEIDFVATILEVDARIISALIKIESNFKPSSVGDRGSREGDSLGLMQVKLATARIHIPSLKRRDLFDPSINIYVGTLHYKHCYKETKDILKAVDLYNRGIVSYRKHPTNLHRDYMKKFLKAFKLF